ncbi:hypothetical protein SAMN05216548_12135 [Faunimonas pinastri]|uniref:Uncharacterized protein n=2 Tax=Faunimonas pinastri TaxID=1855383 RepID=A0A1H9PP08_9HYPH|nr:hypothetical protein SAMN05216548_12135 [Faunimonas pinastri]
MWRLVNFDSGCHMIGTIIATALSSGVIAASVSFFLTLSKETMLERQKKMESAFDAFSSFDNTLASYFIQSMSYVNGKISKDQLNDLIIASNNPVGSGSLERLEMLVGFYFPSLELDLRKYLAARDLLNVVLNRFDRQEAGPKDYDGAMRNFIEQGNAFKSTLLAEGRSLARLNPLTFWLRRENAFSAD